MFTSARKDECMIAEISDGAAPSLPPLGSALLVIRGCSVDALIKAIQKVCHGRRSGTSGVAVAEAVNAVLGHVGDGTSGAAAAVVDATLNTPPQGHAVPAWYRKASLIQAVLLFHSDLPAGAAVATARALCAIWAEGADKSRKLRCSRVLRVLHDVCTTQALALQFRCSTLLSVLQSARADLLRLHQSGRPDAPTRLMVETSDCLMVCSGGMLGGSVDDTTDCLGIVQDVAELTSVWYSSRHRLFSAAAAAIAEAARQSPPDSMMEILRETTPLLTSRPLTESLRWQAVRRATEVIRQIPPPSSEDKHCAEGCGANSSVYHLVQIGIIGLAIGRDDSASAMNCLADAGCGLTELLSFAARPSLVRLDCTRRVVVAVLRTAMGTALHGAAMSGEMIAEHLQCIFSLARTGGALSEACSGVLVDLVKEHPDVVLGQVFDVFDKAAPDEQLNVLAVLRDMTKEGITSELSPQLRSLLSSALMERLCDAEVKVRNLSATVLGRLGPEYSVAALCNRLIERDDRQRSAAERTLISMLSDAPDPTVVLQSILAQCASVHLEAPPVHPGQLGTLHEGATATQQVCGDDMVDKRRDRVLHMIERWVDSEKEQTEANPMESMIRVDGDSRWSEIVAPYIVNLVLTKPEDTARVQLATRIAPRLGQSDCLPSVLSMILRVLEEQGPLCEDALDRDATGDLTKVLLFQRLSPLLLLRMLPTGCFNDTAVESQLEPLRKILLSRISRILEFDDVRRVSAELFSRGSVDIVLRPILTLLSSEIESLCRADSGHDPQIAKGAIYALCCAVALQSQRDQSADALSSFVPEIVHCCLQVFALKPPTSRQNTPDGDGLIKLQRGCIDLLGLLSALEAGPVEHTEEKQSSPKIVMLCESDGAATSQAARRSLSTQGKGALAEILAALQGEIAGPTPICLVNALIGADRHVQQLCNNSQAAAIPFHATLLCRTAPTLLSILSGQRGGPVRLRAACSQAIFTMAFRLQNDKTIDRFREELIDVALAVLSEEVQPTHAPLRLGAVKILGTVLGRVISASVSGGGQNDLLTMPGTGLTKVHSVLVGLSNLDRDPEVKSIATNLLRALSGSE